MGDPLHAHSSNPNTVPWLGGNGLWSPSPASPSSVIAPPPPTAATTTAASSSSSPSLASPLPDTAAARRSEEVASRGDQDDVSAHLKGDPPTPLSRVAATMTEHCASPVSPSRVDAPPKTQKSAIDHEAAKAQQQEEKKEEMAWVVSSPPSLPRDGDTAMWPPSSETAHTGSSQRTAPRHTDGVNTGEEGYRSGREIAPSSLSAPTAEEGVAEWTGCQHSDPPARYRDTPAYYCTYCSYTICQACFTLLPPDSPDAQPSSLTSSSSSSREEASLPAQREEEQPLRGPVEGVEMRKDAAGVVLASAQPHAVADMNWLDTVLHTTTTTAAAPPIPLLCRLCRRGHLMREEALLHEWCCEGPAPTERLHRGHNFIYATHNLQKYHFMRGQREARLVSTAPLQAQLLSVSPALLTERETSPPLSSAVAVLSVQPCEETRATGRVLRDVAPENAQHQTRRGAVTTAITGKVRRHCKDDASHRHGRSAAVRAAPQLACEEGGSFTFAVHNPRLDVQLVWCGVNRQPREEAPSYAREEAGGMSSCAVGTAAVTVTPLLLWRCPPSLPGLPARPYRLHVPYGLYAFANLHALALYEARDIYRKATAQIIAAPGGGNSSGFDVTSPRLTTVTVAPASTLRPLLTVSILHHVAATAQPLPLSLPGAAVGPMRKRGRSATPPQPPLSPNAVSGVPSAKTTAAVQWPDGLASPELSLCVDHLLHGRSVAVYGVASKHFFLHHVACSAALKAYHVVTVDASLGRVATSHGSGTYAAGSTNSMSGARQGAQSMAGSGERGNAPSAMRQLLSVGHVLLRRVSGATVLTAEARAAMTAAAAAAACVASSTHASQTHAQRRRRANEEEASDEEEEGAVQAGAPVARALLEGDAGRSPAMARDVTASMLRHHYHRLQPSAVTVVDVDSSLSSSSAPPPPREPSHTEGVTSCGVQTPPHATPSRCDTPTPHTRVLLAGCTPLSQRVHTTQLGQTPPLPSPIPSFFAALQRSVRDIDDLDKGALRDEDSVTDTIHTTPAREEKQRCRQDWTELPEYFGPLNSLSLPPMPSRVGSPGKVSGAAPSSLCVEQQWRAAPVEYANDAVRRYVLQGLRRQHAARRCVRWASLPSPTAAKQLAEQGGRESQPLSSASPDLMAAHAVRPGWQPPVLLMLHNVDRLEASEAAVLLQLCAQFAFPQPHLQLLLSFDDPLWPLGSVAAALARLGVCAVQLRSLLLPRVHETLHVSSVHLLTDVEAATAAAAGSGGGRKKASGSSLTPAAGGGGCRSGVVGGAGTSHLLQDTLHRVLFSLPPAFSALLRIVLDVQDDVGEGVFVSLFTITERFEASGVMVSQGRLKALLRELTSNRIARYDSAEHALMVPQVGRLRRVLDEVTAQRKEGGVGDGGTGPRL